MATAGKANAKEGPKEINFSWEGKNKAGKVVRGDIRAASESVANAALRRQGFAKARGHSGTALGVHRQDRSPLKHLAHRVGHAGSLTQTTKNHFSRLYPRLRRTQTQWK